MENSLLLGVDLITFYNPSYWGLEDFDALLKFGDSEPHKFWEQTLDAVSQTGVGAIELTFGPSRWQNALAAYGSAKSFAEAVQLRGLKVVSHFVSDFESPRRVVTADEERAGIDSVLSAARFLREAGGSLLVCGLPLRSTYRSPSEPFGFDEAKRLADVFNRLGQAVASEGIGVALHTEHSSSFATRRDIDLILSLTDPEFVGFCPDTAHITLAGGNPVAVVTPHLERVAITHWKDATGPYSKDLPVDELIHDRHDAFFSAVGQGVVDWQGWANLMRDHPLQGCHILEIDAVANPVEEVTKARVMAERVLQGSD